MQQASKKRSAPSDNDAPKFKKSLTMSKPTPSSTQMKNVDNLSSSFAPPEYLVPAADALQNEQSINSSSSQLKPSLVQTKNLDKLSLSSSPSEPRISSKGNPSCDNIFCHQRYLKSDETILNLTRLLDHQLKIVDEMRLEARELGGRYEELRQKLDDKYEGFEARIFNKQTENKASSPYPPPGYRRNSDDNIHMSKGVWIAWSKYNEACNSNSPPLFVKILCDRVFSPEELKNSTVTGRTSNRKKPGSLSRAPKKLDPTRVLAIKDITRYWLETLNMSDEAVDNKVEKVKGYISTKIAELQRPPYAKGRKRRLSEGEGQGVDTFEGFPDDDLVLDLTLDGSNLLSSESDSGASENANIRRILEDEESE